MDDLVRHCQTVLQQLQRLVTKYKSLGTNHKRTWDRVKFGTEGLQDIREKLTFHTSAIQLFLTTLGTGSLSRIESKLEVIIEEIRSGRREPTVLSTCDDDNVEAEVQWNALKSELVDDGFTKQDIEAHKHWIKAHLQELIDKGELQERVPATENPVSTTTASANEQRKAGERTNYCPHNAESMSGGESSEDDNPDTLSESDPGSSTTSAHTRGAGNAQSRMPIHATAAPLQSTSANGDHCTSKVTNGSLRSAPPRMNTDSRDNISINHPAESRPKLKSSKSTKIPMSLYDDVAIRSGDESDSPISITGRRAYLSQEPPLPGHSMKSVPRSRPRTSRSPQEAPQLQEQKCWSNCGESGGELDSNSDTTEPGSDIALSNGTRPKRVRFLDSYNRLVDNSLGQPIPLETPSSEKQRYPSKGPYPRNNRKSPTGARFTQRKDRDPSASSRSRFLQTSHVDVVGGSGYSTLGTPETPRMSSAGRVESWLGAPTGYESDDYSTMDHRNYEDDEVSAEGRGERPYFFPTSNEGQRSNLPFRSAEEIFNEFSRSQRNDHGNFASLPGRNRQGGGFQTDSAQFGVSHGDIQEQISAPEVTIVERPVLLTLEELFTGTKKRMKIRRKVYNKSTRRRGIEDKIVEMTIKPGLATRSKIGFKGVGDLEWESTPEDPRYQDVHFIVTEVHTHAHAHTFLTFWTFWTFFHI